LFASDGARVKGEENGQVAGEAGLYFVQGDSAGEQCFERGGAAIRNAAGDDQIEVAKVGGDVVGETVGGNPAADVDADGGEFSFGGVRACAGLDPDASLTGDAIRGDTEIGRGTDHGFFERADVPADVAFDVAEIEDGIADDLAGTVVGDVSATIGRVEFDAFLAEDAFGDEEIGAAGVATESDDVGMLAEKEDVVDGGGFEGGDEALLEGVGVRVGD